MLNTPQKQPHSDLEHAVLSPSQVSTPSIPRLSQRELQVLVKKYRHLLRAKDEDLKLAAEIGQSLLQTNQQLQQDIDRLKSSSSGALEVTDENAVPGQKSAGRIDEKHVLMLEESHSRLENQLGQLRSEHEELKQVSSKIISSLQEDKVHLADERENTLKRLQMVELENERLSRDRAQWMDQVKSGKQEVARDLEQYQQMYEQLEENHRELTKQYQLQQDRAERYELESKQLKQECLQLRADLGDASNLSEQYSQLSNDFAEAQMALQEANQTMEILTAQLEIYRPKELDLVEDPGNKSLFSEVEDKRKELEDKHRNLSQKHQGLMKAHVASVHQQERMKHHISRLTQLSQNQADSLKIKRLEDALGRAESENKKLQSKLVALEKELVLSCEHGVVSGSEVLGHSSVVTEEAVRIFRVQIEQLTQEVDTLKKELRTTNMLKLNEMEKVRTLESSLAERESDLDRLRAIYAQVKFETDELKLKLKMREDQIQFGELDVAPVEYHPKQELGLDDSTTPDQSAQVNPEAPVSLEVVKDALNVGFPIPVEDADEDHATDMSRGPTPTEALELRDELFQETEGMLANKNRPKDIYVKRENVSECNQQ